MLAVEPVAATAGGAVCAALGALVGAAAPAGAGAAGVAAGGEQAAASASAAMPPMPFNRSRRLTDAMAFFSFCASAFDGARGDAFDDVPLNDQKQDQHGQYHVQRAGHDQAPQGAGFLLEPERDADRLGAH